MNLNIVLSNPKTSERLDIKLPMECNALADALERFDCDETVSVRGNMLPEYGRRAVSFHFENCSAFELNHLATLLQGFEDDYSSRFIGGYFLMSQKEPTDVPKSINLAMNIQTNNLVYVQPAMDECDLAKFHMENDLIPELADVTDEAYQWVMDHTNLQELGEEIRQKENGTFISGEYVTMDKLDDLYDGKFQTPTTWLENQSRDMTMGQTM